jgi:hypothetical protein
MNNEFKKYPHLERFGKSTVQGIDQGLCYIFPKIDGSNASVWLKNGEVQAGSRKNHLSVYEDNRGFCQYAQSHQGINKLLNDYPHWRVFGEWLVPQTLKVYDNSAWRQLYAFDVIDCNTDKFLSYDVYAPILKSYGIIVVEPLMVITNPSIIQLQDIMNNNKYLITEVEGVVGEGIVIKNYDWVNRFGQVIWAKMISTEFSEKHKSKPMRVAGPVEEQVIDEFCTETFIQKEFDKFVVYLEGKGSAWEMRYTKELLGRIWHEFIVEESFNFVNKHRNPVIDFRNLHQLFTFKVKNTLDVFADIRK